MRKRRASKYATYHSLKNASRNRDSNLALALFIKLQQSSSCVSDIQPQTFPTLPTCGTASTVTVPSSLFILFYFLYSSVSYDWLTSCTRPLCYVNGCGNGRVGVSLSELSLRASLGPVTLRPVPRPIIIPPVCGHGMASVG